MDHKEKQLFDDPKTVKRILYCLYVFCGLLLAMDFIVARHVVHSWENLSGFYAVFGFVSCIILVLVAKWMRRFLMRPEDYYEAEELIGVKEESNVDA